LVPSAGIPKSIEIYFVSAISVRFPAKVRDAFAAGSLLSNHGEDRHESA
jgi:hypothetical protein